MLTSSRRALAASFVLLAGCSYPSFGFVPDDQLGGDDVGFDAGFDAVLDAPVDTSVSETSVDGGVDSSSETSTDTRADTADTRPTDASTGDAPDTTDAGCTSPTGGDPCAKIPKFKASKQVFDAKPDEFCGVPTTTWTIATAAHAFPSPVPAGVDTVLVARVAWSTTGLHVHIHVTQSMVFTPIVGEELWHGDAVEVFASGFSKLTGNYTAGNDTGATQIIMVPASGTKPGRASIYLGEVVVGDVDPTRWATRNVADGYEVELLLLWSELKGTPASGLAIGFDLAVDVRQISTGATPLVQALYALRTPTPTTCTRTEAHPSCDDRAWCTPTLE